MFKDKVIQGTGNTCIFFHNSYLLQYVLEGKHPSSKSINHSNFKKFSVKIEFQNKVRSPKSRVGSGLEAEGLEEKFRKPIPHISELQK